MRITTAVFLLLLVPAAFAGTLYSAGPSGGPGGAEFRDNPASDFLQIDSVTICGGKYVDSIQISYNDVSGNVMLYEKHGGTGGICKSLYFYAGEYIHTFGGASGVYIDSITITTNFGRVLRVGGAGGQPFVYEGSDQFHIAGVKGRSGRLVDAIGVVYNKMY